MAGVGLAVERPEPSGRILLEEIREQPAALMRLLGASHDIERVGTRLASRPPALVRLVAHGSSDNAAVYGLYAFGLLPGWTAVRDSISLSVYYGAELDLRGSVVVALSQSGHTPDVLAYVQQARQRGALTVAVTNEPDSELAALADEVLLLAAGPERAVAATKTYTNQLAVLALLAAHAAGRGRELTSQLRVVADRLAETIASLEPVMPSVAVPLAFVGRMFVIGRGPELATARETALKLTETCRVAAEPMTATDLAHGPVAALDSLFPVWAIASHDASLPAVVKAAERAQRAGATLIACGSAADALPGARYRLPTPEPPALLLSPLLSVAPGQLFAFALAQAKGLDPDRPSHISKVTLAP